MYGARLHFSLKSLLILTTWLSVWLAACIWINHLNESPLPPPELQLEFALSFFGALFAVIAAPLALIGYFLGNSHLGIVVGIALIIVLIILALPSVH